MANDLDIICDEDVIPKKRKLLPNKKSLIRKQLLKDEKFRLKGDKTDTNIFNVDLHYLDQTGNIRSRETDKVLYKFFQVERITTGDNPIMAIIEANNTLPWSVGNPDGHRSQPLRQSATNPVGFANSIVEECGVNGEAIVKELCEIALNKEGVVSVKDKLEALKLLTYYFAGKPIESKQIDKNTTSTIEKRVASFMKIVGGKQ